MEHRVSLRLNEGEVRVLESIALKNNLTKSSNVPSISKALKYLIQHFGESNDANAKDHTGHILNLLEQINVMIPHLVLHTNFASRVQSEDLSEDEYRELLVKSLDATKRLCGQIQTQNYESLYISEDAKKMKTIPIEEAENRWKLG